MLVTRFVRITHSTKRCFKLSNSRFLQVPLYRFNSHFMSFSQPFCHRGFSANDHLIDIITRGPQAQSFSSSHVRLNLSLASCGPLKVEAIFYSPYFSNFQLPQNSDCILCHCYPRNNIILLALLLSSTAKLVSFACQR